MGAIDARQLRMLTETLDQHEVEYLYIGKSAAIIHSFADTTQDADIPLIPRRGRHEPPAARREKKKAS